MYPSHGHLGQQHEREGAIPGDQILQRGGSSPV